MGEIAQDVQLHILGLEAKETTQRSQTNVAKTNQRTVSWLKKYKWWLLMALYSFFLLAGQSAAMLLGRLYFDKGGNSNWMATLVQLAGFPILLPLYFLFAPRNPRNDGSETELPSKSVLALMYALFGILLAGDCLLYSLGQKYLPVSTYSLICATQLGFNAFFSFFLNSLKFTAFIVNSLVLLTISSIVLVFQQDDSSESTQLSKSKYPLGFIFTVAASAGYGLMLSLNQYAFNKILKQENFKVVLDMIVYPSLVSTMVVLVGLFASGEWKGLAKEMDDYELGKLSYLMTLIWIAISWQVFSVGCVGLIYEVSSLFSNAISTLGLPIVPILAVIFFRDSMGGIKVVALILAIWGFISYIYQHYLDDCKAKTQKTVSKEDSEASSTVPINKDINHRP